MAFLLHWFILFGFWLLLSGMLDAFHLVAGIACSGAVAYASSSLGLVDLGAGRGTVPSLTILPWHRVFTYSVWLLVEIAKANWQVLRIVLDPRLPIDPALIRLRSRVVSDLGVTLFANSITLTPGTITVQVSSDEFLIHALVGGEPTVVGLGDMQRRVIEALPGIEPGADVA
jgi:multicomponent Na+:H+ antiporter subunit E